MERNGNWELDASLSFLSNTPPEDRHSVLVHHHSLDENKYPFSDSEAERLAAMTAAAMRDPSNMALSRDALLDHMVADGDFHHHVPEASVLSIGSGTMMQPVSKVLRIDPNHYDEASETDNRILFALTPEPFHAEEVVFMNEMKRVPTATKHGAKKVIYRPWILNYLTRPHANLYMKRFTHQYYAYRRPIMTKRARGLLSTPIKYYHKIHHTLSYVAEEPMISEIPRRYSFALYVSYLLLMFFCVFPASSLYSFLPSSAPTLVNIDQASVGIILASYGFGHLIFGFGVGTIVNKMGSYASIALALTLVWGSNLSIGVIASNLEGRPFMFAMCALRFLMGIGVSLIDTNCTCGVVEVFPDNMEKAFAWYEATQGCCYIVGPILGGILYEHFGFSSLFYIMTCVGVALTPALLAAIWWIEKKNSSEEDADSPDKMEKSEKSEQLVDSDNDDDMKQEDDWKEGPRNEEYYEEAEESFSMLKIAFQHPMLMFYYYLCIVAYFGTSFLESTLDLELGKFGLEPSRVGWVISSVSISYVFGAPIMARIISRIGRNWCLFVGSFLIVIGLAIEGPFYYLPLPADSLPLHIVGAAMVGVGAVGLCIACLTCILNLAESLGEGAKEILVGIGSSMFAFGEIIGQASGSVLFYHYTYRTCAIIVAIPSLVVLIVIPVLYAEKWIQKHRSLRTLYSAIPSGNDALIEHE